ncbi:type III secretion system protein SsaP, partial [Salmonella enterica subsp. enterica serovar Montevideo]|nr:type III secretion system protein SsaP [Salmonella enterica subsp. enterica serovar Montevideo]
MRITKVEGSLGLPCQSYQDDNEAEAERMDFAETGMANKVGGVITRFAKTEKQLIFTIMVVVGLMSGVLSNTGT